MSKFLNDLRAFANREDDVFTNESTEIDGFDFENDEQFMQECYAACLPSIIQNELLGESAELMDEATREAFVRVADYLEGQGYLPMSESTSVTLNQKTNVIHMGKAATIARLKSIITLKMARKAGDRKFTKYKMGCKIKKDNMTEMKKKYGDKAERIAKKLYAQTQKNHKVSSAVSQKKEEIKAKK